MKNKLLLWLILCIALATAAAAQVDISQYPGLVKLAEHNNQMAQGLTLLIALIAGALTVTSPCGFAILPTFFSFWFKDRKRAVWMTVAFTIGLALAFTLMGSLVALLGDFYGRPKTYLGRFAGIFLIIFGLMLLLNRGFRVFNFKIEHKPNRSFWSIFVLGFGFGLGWTPCVGPVLGSILVLAGAAGSPLKGALMMFVYAIGTAIPLLILAYLSDKGDWAGKKWLTGKHLEFTLFGKKIITHTYNLVGGAFLILIGGIMVAQNGTYFFMEQIPQYMSWDMETFFAGNQALMNAAWFSPAVMNFLGVVAVALLGIVLWRHVKRQREESPSVKKQPE